MNLSIIITGQIRTFNRLFENFKNMILNCYSKYNYIYIVLVISGDYDNDFIYNNFNKILLKVKPTHLFDFNIINYNNYINDCYDFNNKKFKSLIFNDIKTKYLNENNMAKNEINNVEDFILKGTIQFHQLKIGIDKVLLQEKEKNIIMDVIMRTRFDVIYPDNFIPVVFNDNEDIYKKLLFNEFNFNLFEEKLNKYNIKNIDELIYFLKQQHIVLQDCRINFDLIDFSFGGAYFYNFCVIENIYNGKNNILYSFNDHFFFSKRDSFIKLYNFFDEYGLIEPFLNIKHYYAQESQFLLFCIKNDINILMYLNNSYSLQKI